MAKSYSRSETEGLIRLLGEYASKLDQLANELRSIAMERTRLKDLPRSPMSELKDKEAMAMRMKAFRLTNTVNEVARRASALVEHVVEDEIVKLELTLRIADVEASSQYAQQMANSVVD